MPFTETTGARVICIVCRTADGHDATCPLTAIDAELKDLTAHVGGFVANMQETMERIAHILRDEEP